VGRQRAGLPEPTEMVEAIMSDSAIIPGKNVGKVSPPKSTPEKKGK